MIVNFFRQIYKSILEHTITVLSVYTTLKHIYSVLSIWNIKLILYKEFEMRARVGRLVNEFFEYKKFRVVVRWMVRNHWGLLIHSWFTLLVDRVKRALDAKISDEGDFVNGYKANKYAFSRWDFILCGSIHDFGFGFVYTF